MARRWGLGRRAAVAAALSVALIAVALAVAVAAATGARADDRELSVRLVPAAVTTRDLLRQYNAQPTALHAYVTSGRPAGLAPFRAAAARLTALEAREARLVRGYLGMPGLLAADEAAQRAWLTRVAEPELAAMRSGHLAAARALAADSGPTRTYLQAVRARMATLLARITAAEGRVAAALSGSQRLLLAGLLAACALAAVIAAGGVVAVRRWLLGPLVVLHRATASVAAGSYDTQVPSAGPPELADLGRSAELTRTRLVAALAEAEQAEDRFRGLFEHSPDATLTVSQDRLVVMANAAADQMFGFGDGELAGQHVQAILPAAAQVPDSYFASLPPGPFGSTTATAVRRDGSEFPAETNVTVLATDAGPVGLVSVRDISARLAEQAEAERLRAEAEAERYERRLAQSQRLESLGQLVGGIAHDFNNLLGVITGYTAFIADQITERAADDDDLRPLLADIEQVSGAADRAARLTRQLLTFARRDIIRPETLDVGTVISGLEQMLRITLGERIVLVSTASDGLWTVTADPGQLEQILLNLAVNARDAMPDGGTLAIDTANIEADDAYAASRPELHPGRYVRLRVSDTGTGMDSHTLARVFEPFYTTKPQGQGTGLGLATVYGIVAGAGGYVQIYSELDIGTTVTVLLPATSAAASPRTAAEPAAPVPGRGETILIAEDEPDLWQLAHRILTSNGYHVAATATAADALRHASDPAQPVDLLLTDVIMPDMLGNEVAARLRDLRPGLPVLYMSGYAQPVLHAQGALDPGVDLIEKPFTLATLLTRVRDAIDRD